MPKYQSVQTDRQLAEKLPYGIALVDANAELLWWNRTAERMFGFYAEDNQASSLLVLLEETEFHRLFQSKDEHLQIEINSPHRSNKRLRLQLRSYDDNAWLVISEDVTDVHKLRAIKQDFVANVSHELRTPLTVFCGYLELLLEKPDEDSAVLVEMLKQMSGQGRRMQNLINDLLWLSRLETKSVCDVDVTVVDVSTLIHYIHNDALALCKSSGKLLQFTLEVDACLQLKGNLDELRSAFANIVSNAVRYTATNGQVRIRWFEDAVGLKFQVTDTGLGIPEKYIPRITQRFYRTDEARSCEQGGTGLGLAIVKHVLLRNQARLEIESTPGVGSVFTCVFPLQAAVRSSGVKACREVINKSSNFSADALLLPSENVHDK